VVDTTDLTNHNRVKCVLSKKNNLLYLTRQSIPSTVFDVEKRTTFYRQTCIIAFRGDILQEYSKLERTPLEIIEGIDMLRLIENEYTIASGVSTYTTQPVDTPEDIEKVKAILKSDPWFNNNYNKIS
jgi:3-deoxy-manno-octulosonate cytidylyltransferase (CMP-KDO synthetase)